MNHVGVQTVQEKITDISAKQLHETFAVNVYSMCMWRSTTHLPLLTCSHAKRARIAVYLTQAALPHLPEGGAIINTTSVTAYKGNALLIDYSASKGAQVAFTYSLSQSPQVLEKRIRVNAVAPGPIWTPLIPATFPPEKVASFGKEVPMQRPGQPEEVAACYVFLASNVDSSYITGQVLHLNGGAPIHR